MDCIKTSFPSKGAHKKNCVISRHVCYGDDGGWVDPPATKKCFL